MENKKNKDIGYYIQKIYKKVDNRMKKAKFEE